MKKECFCFLCLIFVLFPVFSQSKDDDVVGDENLVTESAKIDENEENTESEIVATKGGLAEVPDPKRPRPIDKEKLEEAAKKDESEEDEENHRNTIKYGIPSEISVLLDDLMKNEDLRFTEEIYDLFQVTRSTSIKEKILKYFTKLEDPCLEDFAVNLLNDPYDEKNEVVKASFQYISAVKTKEAVPAVITLIESENENYFTDAITTLGDIGGPSEAMFLIEYLDRPDLSDAQRQSLMRTCGKMHAVETWQKLVDVLENEDENAFVRMYAAEAIGLMKTPKSVPVLVKNFEVTDPNLRQYVIKGLANFPDVIEAKSVILQGIRDEHWRVRQESILSAKEMDMKESVPYLIYRTKNDSEKVIKDKSIESISKLNTQEGNDFLIEQLKEKKVTDTVKSKIVEVLLKEGNTGDEEILELAESVAADDKRKSLRYAIGKELVKYYKPEYEKICCSFLESKDSATVSIGLDLYKNGRYKSAEPYVRKIAEDKKGGGNKTRAQKLLGIDENEVGEEKSKEKVNEKTVQADDIAK